MVSEFQKYRNTVSIRKFDFNHALFKIENHRFTVILILIAALCLAAEILLHTVEILPAALIAGCVSFVWYSQLAQFYPLCNKLFGQRRLRFRLLSIALFGFLLATLLAHPAHAQFFGDAETWMSTNFGGDTGDAIPLVFNVLRGLFLLYVGISLVRVINASRQDEDWQTIARTPLIIIIAVTAADVLTTLITG